MNLLENEELVEKNKKMKKIMIIITVFIILLLIASIILVYRIYVVQKDMLKLSIDNRRTNNFTEDTFIIEDNELYISIKDFANLIDYQSFNGDYKQYSEDITKCYIENTNEVASFALNSNKIYKTIKTGTDYEYYTIEKPVKMINNKLYTTMEGMQIGCNSAITYDTENNQISVFTLPYLTTYYTGLFNDSAIGDETADFSNQKALLYNMIVVRTLPEGETADSSNVNGAKYGVKNLDGQEIIGPKYKSIKFIESSQDFIVTTEENKMGILAANGTTKIQPTYDEIKQIDKDLNLYLVTNNKKQGVINQNGNMIVFLEYDQIGVDPTQFTSNNIKNQYLLYDNCIPVQRDKKWGLIDKTGKVILPVEYDQLGCISGTSSDRSSNNTLLVPKYEGIVVGKGEKYNVVTSLGRKLLKSDVDSIYSITNSGEETFYMVFGEQTINLIDYIDKYELKTNSAQQNNNNSTNTNNQANQITQTNSVQQ